ncbi:MAG TPA: hypothetical protein VM884_01080, partial [Flavisolibacter sp.]|nr:hypothetical protein [Flavisolibacter sp.]
HTPGTAFSIKPGIYLLKKLNTGTTGTATAEFYAPKAIISTPLVIHQPVAEVSSKTSFSIVAEINGFDSTDNVSIELRNATNKWKTVPMKQVKAYGYKADVPADMVTPGVINYRIMIKKANGETTVFPGGFKGNPYAWDEYRNESWQTFVASPQAPVELFNATTDKSGVVLYNNDWRNNSVEYITADKPGQLLLKTSMNKPAANQIMGWQYFFKDKISGRSEELSSFTKMAIRARSSDEAKAQISLITTNAQAFATTLSLRKEFQEFEIPLSSLIKDSMLLLPRPYPGFQPLYFTPDSKIPFSVADAEKLEIRFSSPGAKPLSIEIESVWLKK